MKLKVAPSIVGARNRAEKAGKRLVEADPGCRGLYLRTDPNGTQAWLIRYRVRGAAMAAGRKMVLGPAVTGDDLPAHAKPTLHEPLDYEMARSLAETYLRMAKKGLDPAEWIKEEAAKLDEKLSESWEGTTVDQLFIQYMRNYPLTRGGQEARDRTRKQVAGLLGLRPDGKGDWEPNGNGVLSHWHGKALVKITTGEASELLDKMKAKAIAEGDKGVSVNRTMSALKAFGRWAVEQGKWPANLFAPIRKKVAEKKKQRTLFWIDEDHEEHSHEIAALWNAVEVAVADDDLAGYPYGRVFQLGLATGQRPGEEIREARWAEFHPKLPTLMRDPATDWATAPESVKTWTLPPERQKTGNRDDAKPHKVPLSPLALRVLASLPVTGSPYLFTTKNGKVAKDRSSVKRRLDKLVLAELRKQCGDPSAMMEHWTPHDLRRTCETGIVALGFSREIAEAVTNHVIPGMAGVYVQHDYGPEKRKALDAWAAKLEAIIGIADQANVIRGQFQHG